MGLQPPFDPLIPLRHMSLNKRKKTLHHLQHGMGTTSISNFLSKAMKFSSFRNKNYHPSKTQFKINDNNNETHLKALNSAGVKAPVTSIEAEVRFPWFCGRISFEGQRRCGSWRWSSSIRGVTQSSWSARQVQLLVWWIYMMHNRGSHAQMMKDVGRGLRHQRGSEVSLFGF